MTDNKKNGGARKEDVNTTLARERTAKAEYRTEMAEERTTKAEYRTEMARERTRKAADRTLMAWVRTGLSLIGFGVGLTSFRDILGGEREWGRPETVGMMMICLGIVGMVFASFEFISRVRHLERREYAFMKGVPFAVIVAIVTAAIGVFALVAFFVQWLA